MHFANRNKDNAAIYEQKTVSFFFFYNFAFLPFFLFPQALLDFSHLLLWQSAENLEKPQNMRAARPETDKRLYIVVRHFLPFAKENRSRKKTFFPTGCFLASF